MASKSPIDPAMEKAVKAFENSGKSLDELGVAMGYKGEVARKSAWQFLRKTADPRISMLRKFCKALGLSLRDLVDEKK